MLISLGKIRWSVNEEILDSNLPYYIYFNCTSLTGLCIFVNFVEKWEKQLPGTYYNQNVSLFLENIKIIVDFSTIQSIKRTADIWWNNPLQTIVRCWWKIIYLLECYCACFYVCYSQPLQFDTDSHLCLESTFQSTLKMTK